MSMQIKQEKSSLFTHVFFSPDERRLRAGWRIMATLVVILGCLLPVQLLPMPLSVIFQSLGAIALILLARFLIDRRKIASLGLAWNRWSAVDLVSGILIMGIIYGSIYFWLLKAGWLQPIPVDWSGFGLASIAGGLLLGFLWIVFGASWEELLFRGYLLQNIKDGLNLFWAVMIPSVIFGLAHLTNPNATLAGAAGITLAGLMLAYAYLRTHGLWLPIGIHIGNNFFQGKIFGFTVSGIENLKSFHLMQSNITGPQAITGGAFGPEAGLIILPFLLLAIAGIYYYTRGRVKASAPVSGINAPAES